MANLENKIFDLIIVGSGAAGLAAAVYAGRYLMETLVIGEEFGGATAWGGRVENYPGIKSIDGYDLMKEMKKQAESLGAVVTDGRAVRVEKTDFGFRILLGKDGEFRARAVVLAMGARRRKLNLPGEKELTGRGVHYCVTCDAPLYRGKTIAFVGGGDASVKGVNLAGEYAKKIFLITREKEIRAEPINSSRMKKLGDKVEVVVETTVKELIGKSRLETVRLSRDYKGSSELKIDGLFVEIGAEPDMKLVEPLGTALDETGYLLVDNMMRTNVPGVFAAGDATNFFGRFKQDITAAAMGAVAAASAQEYLKGLETKT